MSLTDPQRRALTYVTEHPGASPAMVGWAISDREPALKAQGAGRLGGTMLWRLRKLGLVSASLRDMDRRGRCFSGGWRVTHAGRIALAQQPPSEGKS